MQKITPHLWFDTQAREAATFYTSTFKNSKIESSTVLHNTPSGDCDFVTINLLGQQFMLLSAGPYFKFSPAVSFLVACDTKEEVDELWAKLSEGGKAMMELGSYPFSERYGWTADKYGLSWQIMYMGDRKSKQRIIPTLMFVGDVCGRAEEAVNFYTTVFHDTTIDHFMRYGAGDTPDKEGTIRHAGFTLENIDFAAMDSAREHNFTFTEAISFMVHCETQEEIDYYWEKLSADPKSEQCGWLKDKFGLSWQVIPDRMDRMLQDKDPEKVARVTKTFLQMKKFNLQVLENAYEGK